MQVGASIPCQFKTEKHRTQNPKTEKNIYDGSHSQEIIDPPVREGAFIYKIILNFYRDENL